MAQIVRRKSDNVVEFIFDKYDTITLEATGMTICYGNTPNVIDGITAPYVANTTTHELVQDVTPPARFWRYDIMKYDGSWTTDEDRKAAYIGFGNTTPEMLDIEQEPDMVLDESLEQHVETLETKVDTVLQMLLNIKNMITIEFVEEPDDGDNTERSDSEN